MLASQPEEMPCAEQIRLLLGLALRSKPAAIVITNAA
jgi:hypothetical protein